MAIHASIEEGKTIMETASEMSGRFFQDSESAFSGHLVVLYYRLFEAAKIRYKVLFPTGKLSGRSWPAVRKAVREFAGRGLFLFGTPSQGRGIRDGP
jgi:hypothetical protein